jgi:hypothetical protein
VIVTDADAADGPDAVAAFACRTGARRRDHADTVRALIVESG